MSYFERFQKIKLGLLPPEAVAKPKKGIKKVSDKRNKALLAAKTGQTPLDMWFEERRAEMTGKCALCGGKTEAKNDETYRRSIHHLLEKRPAMFPSVALHPQNWLELCFYGNCCHTNIHNGKISWEILFDSAEWPLIREKLLNVMPFVAESERKNKTFTLLNKLLYGQ